MAQKAFSKAGKSDCSVTDTAVGSPFERPDDATDVTFVVEGKELHFCKSFLTVSSPVFEKMFSSDFKEKESSTIPLPDKTYSKMDIFLQQIHPVHSWKPVRDDILETVLCLADEYQTEHVRLKCQHYITTQLTTNATPEEATTAQGLFSSKPKHSPRTKLAIEQVLFYLRMCDEHKLPESREELINIASGRSVKALEHAADYKKLCDKTKVDLLRARCLWLESC